MPIRVQRTRKAGQPGIPPGAVYVGRGPGAHGRWGNPYKAYDSSPAERRTATLLFANLLYTRGEPPYPADTIPYPTDDEIRTELAGKDLACWCPLPEPGQPDWCHATVLLEYLARLERTSS
ncbi:DUF4326 domain-containing protein [Streptomyces sp. NPDC089424]|uniref:DUF4326 domain-containing protein n=1 Tax=Streptomyces sp. NPDC089424 TaxID=3365917 RepID=UPI00382E960A